MVMEELWEREFSGQIMCSDLYKQDTMDVLERGF